MVKEYWERVLRNTSKAFTGNFLRAVYPSQAQDKFKENKNPVFIIFLGLKDCDCFKGRRSLSRHSSQGSANFGLNLLHVGIHIQKKLVCRRISCP